MSLFFPRKPCLSIPSDGIDRTLPIPTPPEESNDELANVKAVVFMRLNAARDRRDKKAITILEEIMEACR